MLQASVLVHTLFARMHLPWTLGGLGMVLECWWNVHGGGLRSGSADRPGVGMRWLPLLDKKLVLP